MFFVCNYKTLISELPSGNNPAIFSDVRHPYIRSIHNNRTNKVSIMVRVKDPNDINYVVDDIQIINKCFPCTRQRLFIPYHRREERKK